jgi:hypothetical protein
MFKATSEWQRALQLRSQWARNHTLGHITTPSSRSDTAQRGRRTAITSTDEDTALVHSTVSKLVEAGRDVVVVVHSYGGIPGSDAMKGLARDERSGKGLRGGEVALVYICAWMLQQGKCVADYPRSFTIERDRDSRYRKSFLLFSQVCPTLCMEDNVHPHTD